ncbi:MAG: hypothetical protein ACLR60_08435 [Clostridium paraputrificum]
MYKKAGAIILIAILISSNMYLYNKIKKADYDITIGIPVISENNDTAINFSDFNFISNKDEFNMITFYLMDAQIIDKPKVCDNTPNLVLTFNNNKDKIQYYKINIWINENSLIVKGNNDYKLIESNRSKDIIEIIKKYKK